MDRFGMVKDFHIISHNPYESHKDLEEGYDFLKRLSPRRANVDFIRLQVLKGSPLARWRSEPQRASSRSTNQDWRIVLTQMGRLFGSDQDFKEISSIVRKHTPRELQPRLSALYTHVFKPYETGYANAFT